MVAIGDVKERGPKGRSQTTELWRHARSFTSPTKPSTDISVRPNESKSYYTQYLLSLWQSTSRAVRQSISLCVK